MDKSQAKLLAQVKGLPASPGVYKFVGKKGEPLYIGKATSLRNRVRSYFDPNIGEKRSELIRKMLVEARSVQFEKTDSVLEALILEAELIKKHLPHYNTLGKDQKSWNYVVITKEAFPRVLIVRERELALDSGFQLLASKFGPFVNGAQLRDALKIIRKIFPFRDRCVPSPEQGEGYAKRGVGCFNYQIGLCPGVCAGVISEKDYKKTIRHIIQFFRGRKKQLVKDLEKEMRLLAKNREFEKAEVVKNKIFALKHIEDIALIRKESGIQNLESRFRIEAYDIAHISGTNMVGVMTVLEVHPDNFGREGEVNKAEYRMFKIRGQKGADDTRALQEVLTRRLKHPEWRFPSLVVVDGSTAQLNAAHLVLAQMQNTIPVVAVTKDEKHKAKEIRSSNPEAGILAKKYEREILLGNSEAHRFAITFHRKLRNATMRGNIS